jgi:hypothetical protein
MRYWKTVAAVLVVLMLVLTMGLATAAEVSNPSTPLPQPVGASRYWSQFEIQNGLRYRIFVQTADGRIVAALDESRIDFLEMGGGGAAGGAGAGDAGDSGAGASSGGDGGTGGGSGSK